MQTLTIDLTTRLMKIGKDSQEHTYVCMYKLNYVFEPISKYKYNLQVLH